MGNKLFQVPEQIHNGDEAVVNKEDIFAFKLSIAESPNIKVLFFLECVSWFAVYVRSCVPSSRLRAL